MLNDNIELADDEEKIRDRLLYAYLKNNVVRKKIELTDFLFDKEVPEDKSSGRTDIKIQTQNTFEDTKAYYIIECKRLNNQNLTGISGLNSEYVKNGICRFVYDFYSSYFGINGMVGFVVDNLDIDNNITNLNSLLNKDLIDDKGKIVNAMPLQEIKPIQLNEDSKYSYISIHQTTSQNEITLYHLMFDFSKNIACT